MTRVVVFWGTTDVLHNFQVMAEAVAHGVVAHLQMWEGWAALIAAALCCWRNPSWWVPVLVALVVNPIPFEAVSSLLSGRHVGLYAAVTFTLAQLILAVAGALLMQLVRRFR